MLTFGAANLPEGAVFDPESQTFTWTPAYDQAGVYEGIRFAVIDDGLLPREVSQSITITVNDINRPPVLEIIGDRPLLKGKPLNLWSMPPIRMRSHYLLRALSPGWGSL